MFVNVVFDTLIIASEGTLIGNEKMLLCFHQSVYFERAEAMIFYLTLDK